MKKEKTPKPGKWKRRFRRLAWFMFTCLLLMVLVVWTGLGDRWARSAIVSRTEKMTGGRVELKKFRFHTFGLRAELEDFTVHGLEPEGAPPYFHADLVVVDLRIESFFRRKIALDELRIERPGVDIRMDAAGNSNVPKPKTEPGQAGKPWRERLFELAIRNLRLNNGEVFYNNVRVPLAAEGGDFRFAMDFHAAGAGQGTYEGEINWKRMTLVARRYLPVTSDVAAKFSLSRDQFVLKELHWKLPHSELNAAMQLENFSEPAWKFSYQGVLDLRDLREILRKPHMPGGQVEFNGQGSHAKGKLEVRGNYAAHQIDLPYQWFHADGIESKGSYRADNRSLEVPDFEARALDGRVSGRVDLEFSGMKFRAATRAQGMNLAELLAAVDNESFPIVPLHWNGLVDVDSVTTWNEDFKHVDARGVTRWSPPAVPRANDIPATARLDFHFSMDERMAELQPSEIMTPSSRLELRGRLGTLDSGLDVHLTTRDLLPWNDFIHALRGRDAERKRIAGRADFTGRMTGPLGGPTFNGHVKGAEAAYGKLYWDEIEGELTYSPRTFQLQRTRTRRGPSTASLDLRMELDDWGFRPESAWTLELELVRTPADGVQEMFGTWYPARGVVTGQFHGRGTRAAPEFTGLVDISEAQAWGFAVDRARGQFSLRRDEMRISNAEIRKSTGRVTGNFRYGFEDGQVAFDLAGAVIPLEQIEKLQSPRIPLGGQLSFQVKGSGPMAAPTSQGTARIVDLRVGQDVLGSFETRVHSDGRELCLELGSAMAEGALKGSLQVTLGGEYPMRGDLTTQQLDLDAFIQTWFRLKNLTGHSHVNGRFLLAGFLAKPETITVEAEVTRLSLDYQNVKLENTGPIRFTYKRDEVRIERAHIRGSDTDFDISGYARFAGDRRLELKLSGLVNLQLLGGFFPDLEARGSAQVNATIEGTPVAPRVNGRMHIEDAAATLGEMPAGLSHVKGDFVFDASRLLFENVSAEAGGGKLVLAGSLTYGEGPLRYDVNAQATRVRIRYPEGMSWLAGGTLRFSGTTRSALLSGRIVIERLLLAKGFDLASMVVTAQGGAAGPATTSAFLRNLQFDIEATSAPDARMEWSAARFDTEARLRVRGTWEHPILLGHIHLLAGEMTFRGNRYRLTRGDLNFSNPLRLDPLLNLEAVTIINQYEVTLSFNGLASKLTFAFRSDPPLPPSDIVALLALGHTGQESQLRTSGGGAAGSDAGASALLSEAISSQLGGRIERLFGVSRFRVDPFAADTGTAPNTTARITVEQQIERDLVITYITNVSSTQQQVIQVEYSVNRDVSIVALRDQNGTFGIDVKFKKRFK